MREESIKKARGYLIESILNSDIEHLEKLEIAIMLHHIFQEKDYEENKKTLQKVLTKKRWERK